MPGPDNGGRLVPPPPTDSATIARFWEGAGFRLADRQLADVIVTGSPFLRHLMQREPQFAAHAFTTAPGTLFETVLAEAAAAAMARDQVELMRALRIAKARAALVVAVADIGGAWEVETVIAALTRFADTCLTAAVDWLLREAARAGKATLLDETAPSRGCGYTVLAMGKHGAFELNYSSDIDLIVLYERDRNVLAADVEPAVYFVRLTKRLVGLLQDITADGYVFRVDLRLRPDPRATQVAISLEAAAIYYENMGQNWERAAMIKARPAAGDLALGAEFLDRLRPYIWRRHLDFAAIADVQSLKRQIHAVKGHGEIAIFGHNLKLGRGGIREIEFFVQTQQLIAGGRNAALRGRGTLAMLDALAGADWISSAAAAELKDAYRFLRKIEHRIQMVNDEQTHVLPEEGVEFERLARFSGFAGGKEFAAKLRATFECVQGHYAALFEDASQLAGEAGSLVFTGGEDDPETIETLSRMGFHSASEVSATIRGWHFGRYAATRSSRAKELLTELMPALLAALARSGDADQAFLAFDRFLGGLPAGVQLFSLLKANPNLLDLLANVLGTAPRLAEELSRRPKVLDAVLDHGFFGPLPTRAQIQAGLSAIIPEPLALEEVIDRARIFGKEQSFRIGVRVLSDTVGATAAGQAYSNLAELLLGRLHAAVTEEALHRYGDVPGGRSAVIAMGKLGGEEMTAGSDLDLIVVYDAGPGAEMSTGSRPLSVNQYYARLTQRLIASITSPTAEGVLYDVDMRLRPSGSKGPVATSLASFHAYHRESAWTWEKLALTRARAVCGDASLCAELTRKIAAALCQPQDRQTTLADVLDMRRLMLKEQGQAGVWDIKRTRGGLVEVEFLAQTLQLLNASHDAAVLDTNTLQAIAGLMAAGALDAADGEILRQAGTLYQRLTQVLRLCVSGLYSPSAAPAGLNRMVASAAGCPDIATTEALLADTQAKVADIFDRLFGVVA
ncbi:MAG: bifunctional [glutamine synthetase] adenylyltransferase/[glutamine synthetase]-adenylyl-L-tyrosine phosphorylase [Rhizobiales bacterium]|nr:bifunctional [glutamine synthetase] adenylyltransferase/[glutamine synthetase]-adenylyl-L-tyrosine phosphorylase [Hyphomicrobiales bacterium]MBI3674555.1 bifunctional [glutamine synthetase] adenylyltransferase/[glutamine synthetase]-adenylyl-L-tyrosine phosphorylase [Hyphomicrobiales bacterium]